MKKLRLFALMLALTLTLGLCAAHAEPYYNYGTSYENLIGAMEIVNCQSWTSLRMYPDSHSTRLLKVPVGAVVTNCYYQDDRFTYCEYNGIGGYILNSCLSFIYGPVGYEYSADNYLGNMQITNCQSYASLRDYPDTRANLLVRVPLGEIVTNVFYQDDRFSYCIYNGVEGYILNSNLSWVSGGSDGNTYDSTWIGDAWVVNCANWTSLRELPDTSSYRLAKVPLGEKLTDCYYVNDRYACVTWKGMVGYVLVDNLGW
ncbi:MAG: SH3 domain-containing protein [Clostridia bacterium]|nr:SH3 domain-containing protein [Clostridia bacterium]